MNIAIVGSHPETWERAPFDDPKWTIWGFSRKNYGRLPRCDQWFELHPEKLFPFYEQNFPGYMEFLQETGAITQANFAHDHIVQHFGPFFFAGGQLPWIMAHAILLEPETLGLWGIEASGGDYKPQRSEIQHLAQVARSEGIKVIAPGSTVLEPNRLYAFS